MAVVGTVTLEERLLIVKENIAEAARNAGRDPSGVRLIAVSKGIPVRLISQAYASGHLDFGENRVQELLAKNEQLPYLNWHFIGRLQRNKVNKLVRLAPVIHSVDSTELAMGIDARSAGKVQALVEVNVSGEPQKTGIPPAAVNEIVEATREMKQLEIVGLMTMAPRSDDPELARPTFARLAELRYQLTERYSWSRIRHLSMGMSQDYRVAVEEGSTMVRVGEAIFGRRAGFRSEGGN